MATYGDGGCGQESRGDLNDWEVVSPRPPPPLPPPSSEETLGIDSDGLIDPNYFARTPRCLQQSEAPPLGGDAAGEEEEDASSTSSGGKSLEWEGDSPGWIDPTTPRNAAAADEVKEDTDGDEDGFLAKDVVGEEIRELEGLRDLNSGAVSKRRSEEAESNCKFSEWWRTPVYVWRTKVGHVGTLWSIAMAAAVMGFVILGRRWYRGRSHNKKLGIQVNANDKKFTQLMFQAVRVNEAFFAVRRVPVVKSQILYGGCQDVV